MSNLTKLHCGISDVAMASIAQPLGHMPIFFFSMTSVGQPMALLVHVPFFQVKSYTI